MQFNGEPRLYTRFNLTQNMEGDNSQVEMKLSSDMDEEVGSNGVGEHRNHTRDSYLVHKPQRTSKNICFMVITTLLIFIIGKKKEEVYGNKRSKRVEGELYTTVNTVLTFFTEEI